MPKKIKYETIDKTVWLKLFADEYEEEYNKCYRKGMSETELTSELTRLYEPESQYIMQVYNDQYADRRNNE